MTKPACVPCGRFYRMERQGVVVCEMMPRDGTRRSPPGREYADLWKPYKVWMADRWKCQGCGAIAISGYGLNPISERHKADFQEWLDQVTERIYDC